MDTISFFFEFLKMFKLAFITLFCAQAFARPHEGDIESHVVGGTKAQERDYPFVVSLTEVAGSAFCGGALLSDRYVLTAAHCVADNPPVKIGVGSVHLAKQKLYDVDKIIVHPAYDWLKMFNDIALLRLRTPVQLGGNVQTINFPVNENLDGKTVTGLGWGRTSTQGPASQVLLYLKRPIVNNKECAKRLNNTQILDSHICVQGEVNFGMCLGDSGSPLLYKGGDGKNYIAGVVSWGIACAKGFPDVFTRVSYFAQWIKQNMV